MARGDGEITQIDALTGGFLLAQTGQTGTVAPGGPKTTPTEAQKPVESVTGLLLLGGLLLLAFLPLVVALTSSRRMLEFLALVLNVAALALGALGFSLATSSPGGLLATALIGPAIISVCGGLWLAALICGATAAVGNMAERRERQNRRINTPAPMAPRHRLP